MQQNERGFSTVGCDLLVGLAIDRERTNEREGGNATKSMFAVLETYIGQTKAEPQTKG